MPWRLLATADQEISELSERIVTGGNCGSTKMNTSSTSKTTKQYPSREEKIRKDNQSGHGKRITEHTNDSKSFMWTKTRDQHRMRNSKPLMDLDQTNHST